MSVDKNSSREAILRAIDTLRNRHCDINPYSVADEANISRAYIVSTPELMQLLEAARSGAFESSNGNHNGRARSSEDDTSTEAKLREQLDNLRYVETELRRQVADAQTTEQDLKMKLEKCVILIKTLREQAQMMQDERQSFATQYESLHRDNSYLQQQLSNLQAEAANISKSVNIAWQQGYLAGQNAAANADAATKSFVETLAEAADAATVSGINASEPYAPVAAEQQHETYATEAELEATQFDHVPAELPFVAEELPIPLDDPEVLNDPFTAKLLNALQAEGTQIPLEQPAEVEPQPYAAHSQHSFDPQGFAGFDGANYEPEIEQAGEFNHGPFERQQHTPQDQPEPQHSQPHFVRTDSFWDQDMTQQVDTMQYAEMQPPPQFAQMQQPQPQMAEVQPEQPQYIETQQPSHQDHEQDQPGAEHHHSVVDQSQTLHDESAAEWRALQAQQAAIAQAVAVPGQTDEVTRSFSAEELHTLFRNKYVRPDIQDSQEMKAIPPVEPAVANTGTTQKKFVGTKHTEPAAPLPRSVPPDIRKACKMLGVQPEEITRQTVLEAWKREMAKPGVHPDTGGDTEMAIYLNTAKDTLIRWVENQTPKLGKKFGSKNKNE